MTRLKFKLRHLREGILFKLGILDKSYFGKYCAHCGMPVKEIWKQLKRQKWKSRGRLKSVREWRGHKQYYGQPYFYDTGLLRYCENCGTELDEDDIHGENEFMGMVGMSRASQFITTGYKCHNCGYEEAF